MCTSFGPSFQKWMIIMVIYFGCQSDEPRASLVTTNRIINVYGFLVVITYAVLHCLYSIGNKITTATTICMVKWNDCRKEVKLMICYNFASMEWNLSYNCGDSSSWDMYLTLNVWGPIYLGLTMSISWLLMPWRKLSRSLSCMWRISAICVKSMWSNGI